MTFFGTRHLKVIEILYYQLNLFISLVYGKKIQFLLKSFSMPTFSIFSKQTIILLHYLLSAFEANIKENVECLDIRNFPN